jgi:hypothetical protein
MSALKADAQGIRSITSMMGIEHSSERLSREKFTLHLLVFGAKKMVIAKLLRVSEAKHL